MIEIEVELSDIFSGMFDIKYEAIKNAAKAPKKSEVEELNSLGFKSVHYSQHVVELIVKREEKYDYVQAIMNLELSAARIYSRLYDKAKPVQLKYLDSSYRQYEKLNKFMETYMKESNISNWQGLPTGLQEQYKIAQEMYELLPTKISKLNASIHKQQQH